MALTAANVRVAVTGSCNIAPLGTTLPVDATTALAAAFKDVGYVSEDGVTQSISTDQSDIKAWQNGDVVRKIQTSHEVTYQFTMIETNGETAQIYYADPDATDTEVKITAAQTSHNVWAIEIKDGTEVSRIVLPDAQVTERGDMVFKTDEAVGYDITLTAYPDATGTKAYIYSA
ncbi:hypothetical protein [Arthrobacter sp. RCC_34]|uniref:phage tail tube protein n=1 Tax=Arthrobacter sp. RCC_34 TaxID=3239230 RepID=UPI00352606D0